MKLETEAAHSTSVKSKMHVLLSVIPIHGQLTYGKDETKTHRVYY